MRSQPIRLFALSLCAALGIATFIHHGQAQKPTTDAAPPVIPKTWDDEAMASLEVPLAEARYSPVHVSADYYYRIPVRPIYQSYPVYHPGQEPPGYLDRLKQQEPEIAFDASRLKTEEDWIRAGEVVFDAPFFYDGVVTVPDVRDPAWYEKTGVLIAKDGTIPALRYVIRKKGQIEMANNSCGMCHTRVMPDGTVIKGAQGNFPFDRAVAFSMRLHSKLEEARQGQRFLFAAPWVRPDPQARLDQMSVDEMASIREAIPPGVLARHRASPYYPVQVPDLIGVRERRYLDRTGLQLHRSIADLMRYAALNQGGDDLARYGDFIPAGEGFRKLPDPATQSRYSDEQLYALALYLYSLKPPPNPHQFDARASRGQKVFEREGCGACHTPPLYTNNKLTPADGFTPPADHFKKYDLLPVSVGTDPDLTLRTRRGTGYYKVPSLAGVWYRGPFEHSGSVARLEDWFDPRRTRDDYVPTGFRGYGVKTRAVKGHPFGLKLSAADRTALIAFLKTL